MADIKAGTRIEIRGIVRSFILSNYLFGSGDDSYSDSDSFLEKGIMDSTGILELVQFLEERFDIEIGDDEMLPENLDSVSSVCGFVDRKTA